MTITPYDKGFYMPAEWYPHERCWMAWPCHEQSWQAIGLKRAQQAYAKVAKAIAKFEPVTILVNPEDRQEAEMLRSENITLMTLPINDSWTRDTGCTFLLNKSQELAGIDWIHNAWGGNYEDCSLDSQIASAIISATSAQNFKAPLVMEGGSFHTDGEGTLLTTKECLLNPNRNPNLTEAEIENYLKLYLNVEKIIWLNKGLIGDETDGHIDELACFIKPGLVLCLITSDKEDENYNILQENLAILRTSFDAKARPLKIVTVEQPPASYINNERLTLSYINFYRANNGIVMPAFGYPSYDLTAYKLFSEIFTNLEIIQIDAIDVFAGGGGIHCITQQQPKSRKIRGTIARELKF